MRQSFDFLKRHGGWLKWPIALGLFSLLYVLNREQIDKLQFGEIRWEFAAIAFLLCGGSILLTFLRWFYLVSALEFEFRIRDAVRLGFLGYVFNYVMPGAIGGDFWKAGAIAIRQKSRRTVAVATIFLDRMLGLLALFLVGAFVSFYQSPTTEHPAFTAVAWIVRVGSVVGLIGLLVMLHPATPKSRWLNRLVHVRKIGPVCGDFIHAIGLYQTKARILWLAVGISIVGHFGMLSSFYFCALALNAPEAIPDYAAHMLFMPAAEVISMLPIVPGGVGVLEGSIGEFYRFAGYDRGNGFLTGIGYRAITILIAVIGGVYYLTSRREIKKLIHESESAAKTEK